MNAELPAVPKQFSRDYHPQNSGLIWPGGDREMMEEAP
jgi:hypothetical protein